MALEPKGALFDDFIFFELSAEQSSIPPENARRRGFVAHCILWHSPGYILLSRIRSGLALDVKSRKLAGVRQPLDLDFFNPRAGWPTPTPSDPLFHFVPVPFGQRFDRTIGTVADPTREPEILRFANGRSSEVNALNSPAHKHMSANTVFSRRHCAIFIAPAERLQLMFCPTTCH